MTDPFTQAWLNVVLLSGFDISLMGLSGTPVAVGGQLYIAWASKWEGTVDRSAYSSTEWSPEYEFVAAQWPDIATAAHIDLATHSFFRPTQRWHLYYQAWLLLTAEFDSILALAHLPSDADNAAFRDAYEGWRRDHRDRWHVGNDMVPRGTSWGRGTKAQVLTNFECEAQPTPPPIDGRWRTQVSDRRGERTVQTYATVTEARQGHAHWMTQY